MLTNKRTLLLAAMFAVGILSALAALRNKEIVLRLNPVSAKTLASNPKFVTQASDKAKKEEATPVQEGAETPKQKVHRKLFQTHRTGRKLRELATNGTGEIEVRSKIIPPFPKEVSGCPSYPNQTLTSFAHKVDAVVIGSIVDKAYSQLTEDGEFIFSEYNITVEDVLKNNPVTQIQPNTGISVVRPGGSVKLNGRRINAVAGAFKPFFTGGRYLFFLKFIPGTGSYLAFSNGTFLLNENKVIDLTRGDVLSDSVPSFIAETRAAITATACANKPLY